MLFSEKKARELWTKPDKTMEETFDEMCNFMSLIRMMALPKRIFDIWIYFELLISKDIESPKKLDLALPKTQIVSPRPSPTSLNSGY